MNLDSVSQKIRNCTLLSSFSLREKKLQEHESHENAHHHTLEAMLEVLEVTSIKKIEFALPSLQGDSRHARGLYWARWEKKQTFMRWEKIVDSGESS